MLEKQVIPLYLETAQYVRSCFRNNLGATGAEARWIGLENEYVMVDANGKMIQRDVLAHFWRDLIKLGWEASYDKFSGQVVGVKKQRNDLEGIKSHCYDLITTDLGYSILEIDLAPALTLTIAHRYLAKLISLVTSILSAYNVYMLGYGVHPISSPSIEHISQNGRCALMVDLCQQENIFTHGEWGVELHTIDASCQTQVEVSADESIAVVNALNATSSLRIALLANSPIWQNTIADYKALRLMFVGWCWPSRKHQLGMPPRFQNLEHYLDYIFDFRSLAVKREQQLYSLDNTTTFRQFFTDEQGQIGVAGRYEKKRLFAQMEDIQTHCGFAWFNARLQLSYGTVEDRISCQQPAHAHLCASALTLGLVENYQRCLQLAHRFSLDQWSEMHVLACQHGMNFSYAGIDINALLEQLLMIAEDGLRMRGFGEESYLLPLYQRLATRRTPADEVRWQFTHGGIISLIKHNDMCNGVQVF